MKWNFSGGTKTCTDFVKVLTTFDDGKEDLALSLQFESADGTCEFATWRNGTMVGEAQVITWEQGLMILEREGHSSPDMVEQLYDYA